MSIDLQKIAPFQQTNVGFFRFKKLAAETYLITNDVGRYVYLTTDEFSRLIAGEIREGARYDELVRKGFIRDERYEDRLVRSFVDKNRFLAYGPTLHIVVTTLRCNHHCRYCHAAAAPVTARDMDMTRETAKRVIDTIFYTSSPDLTIEFQGGESLLNWDILTYLIEQAEIRAAHLGKNVMLALVTNLSLMDEEKMSYLLDHHIHISTSLDGDEIVHNFNRTYRDGNSFEKVCYWIRRINAEYVARGIADAGGKSQKVGAILTATQKTFAHYREVIDTDVELGLDAIFLRPLNPYGFAIAEQKELGYTTEEFLDFYRQSMDYIMEINRRGTVFREQSSAMYLLKVLTLRDPNYLDERSPCGACIGQVAYNYDGTIYSGDEGRLFDRMGVDAVRMTEVTDDPEATYRAMMESDTTKIMVQASTLDGLPGYNDDVYKPYIGVCPIHAYKTTGNIYPNYALDERRKIGTGILDYLFTKLQSDADRELFEAWL